MGVFKQFCRAWVSFMLFCLAAQGLAATYTQVTFGPEQATRQNGKPVTVSFTIPTPFALQHSEYFLSVEGLSTQQHFVNKYVWQHGDSPANTLMLPGLVDAPLPLAKTRHPLIGEMLRSPVSALYFGLYNRYFLWAEHVSAGRDPVKARIWLNNDRPGHAWVLRQPVTRLLPLVEGENTLHVQVLGKPGDALALSITAVVQDNEQPDIAVQVDPAANEAGWQQTPVTVSFACSDDITGVAFCSDPVEVGEGANQTVTGSARDKAGNEASISVTLSVDVTPPQASLALQPALNAAGWQREPVTAAVTCVDNLSGVALCPSAQTFSTEGVSQQIDYTVSDIAGNVTPVTTALSLDFSVPSLSATVTPAANDNGWHGTSPTVSYTCNDVLSGVASCPQARTVSDEGAGIVLSASALDIAGNSAAMDTTLNVDLTPPALALASPDVSAPLSERAPTFTFSVTDIAPDPGSVSLTWAGSELAVGCSLAGETLTCTPASPLDTAPGDLTLSLSDLAGHSARLSVSLSFDLDQDGVVDHQDDCPDSATGEAVDERGCSLNRDADNDGVLDNVDQCPNTAPGVTVAEDGCDPSQRDTDGDGVADIDDPLPEDPERSTLPIVTITSPQTLATLGASPVTVTGTVDVSAVNFTVNSIVVPFDSEGNWSTQVPLKEGHNTVVASMEDPSGIVSTATLSLSLDLTPPQLTLESHTDGQVVTAQPVSISGLVNDIVRGTIEAEDAVVTVNGQAATIVNRSYLAEGIPLQEGENRITVQGRDQVGNTAEKVFTLVYRPSAGQRLELVSGQGQSGALEEIVPAPLAVRVRDATGQPVADKPVVFRVIQGAGLVAAGTPLEGRGAVVRTDSEGIARTPLRLGYRAGIGNQRVRARVVGYDDEIVFHASTRAGIGDKLSVNSGNNQRVAVFRPLPAPLVAVVTDNGANVVRGARVAFEVSQGNGKFSNGDTRLVQVTDSDGRASVQFTAGGHVGLDSQRVTATLLDGPDDQTITAGFTVSAFVPGNPADTAISGLVVDNQNQPLPGVTVRVAGASREAVSDEQGRFRIEQVPVGPVHLIADGSTAEGEYPSLAYNLVTVSGVDNPLPAPIYMVKLNQASKVWAGPKDVALTLPEVPGFRLEIPAGSVSFPDGSREGYVSVTVVNSNTIPMTPPNGMQPQFIVTIQPTNTLFDPPARLTLPNVDAHLPGRQVEMFSFDHDLEEFVAIGLGTVSEDATTIRSNPGVGVIRAGWHCGAQPGGSGCCEGGPEKECDHCFDKQGSCPGNCELVPERAAEQQIKGNCKQELCSGSQDDPTDKGECEVCEEGSPEPDSSKNGSECEDGCGACVDGSCEIDEDKPKPEDKQDPKDCKTLLCGGGSTPNDSERPEDLTQIHDCLVTACQNGEKESVPDFFDHPEFCSRCENGERRDAADGTPCSNGENNVQGDCSMPGCREGFCFFGQIPDLGDVPADNDPYDCVVPICSEDGFPDERLLDFVRVKDGRCLLCTQSGQKDICQETYDSRRQQELSGIKQAIKECHGSTLPGPDVVKSKKSALIELIGATTGLVCSTIRANETNQRLANAKGELDDCHNNCNFGQ